MNHISKNAAVGKDRGGEVDINHVDVEEDRALSAGDQAPAGAEFIKHGTKLYRRAHKMEHVSQPVARVVANVRPDGSGPLMIGGRLVEPKATVTQMQNFASLAARDAHRRRWS